MTAHITHARQRTERSPLRSAVVPPLSTVLLTGAGVFVTTYAAPDDYRVQVALATGFAALLLCVAVVVIVVQRGRQRALHAQLDASEAEFRRLAEQSLPALVDKLRRGSAPDSALSAMEQPSHASHQQVLRTVAQELGRSEAGKTAAMTACADAAGRMQALSTSMLADLREMEHRHSDEDVLGDLLHLDHRTAQAGRLADSVAVLTGARSGRRWAKPIVMESILRGAMGRIAGYQRVRLHTTVDVAVAGHAAEGVMHALAELLDNAANFSPPTAEVHVYVEEVPAGLVVTIEDSGLVMGDFALRRAERAVSGESLDLTTLSGTRLGLPVVGCLARKHGLAVSFRPSARGGTGVIVRIPQQLISRPQEQGGQGGGAMGARYVPVSQQGAPQVEDDTTTEWGVPEQRGATEPPAVELAPPAAQPQVAPVPQDEPDPLFGPMPPELLPVPEPEPEPEPEAGALPEPEASRASSVPAMEVPRRAAPEAMEAPESADDDEEFPTELPKRVSTLRHGPRTPEPAVPPVPPGEPADEHARAHAGPEQPYQDHHGLPATSPDGAEPTHAAPTPTPPTPTPNEPYTPNWFLEEAERIRQETFGGVEPRDDDVWAAGAPHADPPHADPPHADPPHAGAPDAGSPYPEPAASSPELTDLPAQSAVPYGGYAPSEEPAREPEYGPSGLPKRRRGQALAAARPATPPPVRRAAPQRTPAESAARFGAFRRAVRGPHPAAADPAAGQDATPQTDAPPPPPAPPTSYSHTEDDVR